MGIRARILVVTGVFMIFYESIHAQNTFSVHDMKLSYTNNLDYKKGGRTSGNCVDACNDTIYLHGDSNKGSGFFARLSQNGQRDKSVKIESSYLYMSPIPIKKDTAIFLFSLKDIITLTSDTNGGSEGSCKRGLSFFVNVPLKCSLHIHFDNVGLQEVLPSENPIRIIINGKNAVYQRENNKELEFNLRKGENSIYIDLYDGSAKRSNTGIENSKYWVLNSDLGFEVTYR